MTVVETPVERALSGADGCPPAFAMCLTKAGAVALAGNVEALRDHGRALEECISEPAP